MTVGVELVATSVNVNVSRWVPLSVALVTELMSTMMVSLPSVTLSDTPENVQLVEVLPAGISSVAPPMGEPKAWFGVFQSVPDVAVPEYVTWT